MVDLPAYVGAQSEELAVDSVQDGLEEVPLAWVLAVKQLQHLQHKRLVNVPLGDGCLDLRRLEESEGKCIHQLRTRTVGGG